MGHACTRLGCMHVRDWAACMYAIGLHVGATGVRVRVFGVARCVVEGEVKELFPSRRFDAKGDMERMGRVVGERLVDIAAWHVVDVARVDCKLPRRLICEHLQGVSSGPPGGSVTKK